MQRRDQEKEPQHLSQQEQMALIRQERAKVLQEQKQIEDEKKAKEEASYLLDFLSSMNEFFEKYALPQNQNTGIFSSNKESDNYHIVVIELQPKVDEFVKFWQNINSNVARICHFLLQKTSLESEVAIKNLTTDLIQLFKYSSNIQSKLNYVVENIYNRDEERRYHDKSILVEVRLIKNILQRIMCQISHDYEDEMDISITPATTSVNTVDMSDNINESNAFLLFPNEIMINILRFLPLSDLISVRDVAKSNIGVVDATLDLITKPQYVIQYLSNLDSAAGHQFTAFYQRTERYQELKRKVLANAPMTSEEIICYTLTRDCDVLPADLAEAMQDIELDENTRAHLKLIIAATQEITTIKKILTAYANSPCSSSVKRSVCERNQIILMDLLKQHHLQRFVNLLAGADLSYAFLVGFDFSYLNLRGVKFNEAILAGANFSGAYLTHVDLRGALLNQADFTDANLTGVQLSRANLDGANLSANNLYRTDFEICFHSQHQAASF